MKRNHLAILFLFTAIVLDHAFNSYSSQLGRGFQMSLVANLMRLRPVFLMVFYALLFFAASRGHGELSPYLLVVIAVLLLFAAFPMMNFPGFRLPAQIYQLLNSAAVSRLGLTLHSGGLILAYGLFRRIASQN